MLVPPTPPRPVFQLDAPRVVPGGKRFRLLAWCASATPIREVCLRDHEGRRSPPLPLAEGRADARARNPTLPHLIDIDVELEIRWIARGVLTAICTTADGEFPTTRDLPPAIDPLAKADKLARILPHLRTDLPFEQTTYAFDFLSPALRETYNIVEVDAVSDHGYDPISREIIERHQAGLVLDAGAGCRDRYLSNVVNFEIVPYPSTDVVGVGEELPFADGSFDAVLSLDVLEHVKDPFRCARELARVLKPGGELYVVVPFLQPYHGYPHHYYNMTHQGLANLFAGSVEISRQAVPSSGVPMFTLGWFLQRYAEGLPEETRAQFEQMKIADLLGLPDAERLASDIVTKLDERTALHLASTTMLRGRKRV